MSPTAALTRAIARGDPSAFTAFYDAWFERCLALARARTGRDESFCLDVVQESMMRVIRKMVPLETEAALAAWMVRVVETTAIDQLRGETRRLRREQGVARTRPEAEPALDPSRDSDARERERWLARHLEEAPPAERELLAARYARGETLDAAGARLGMTGDAAHGRVRRFVERLQRLAKEVFRD